jgi:hypothetical protein
MRLRRTVGYGLPRSTIFFPTLPHKRHDFRGKKVIEHKIYVLIFSNMLEHEWRTGTRIF